MSSQEGNGAPNRSFFSRTFGFPHYISRRNPVKPPPAPVNPRPETYYPTVMDALRTRFLLANKVYKGDPGWLPPEIVDQILDYAGYWPSVENVIMYRTSIADGDRLLLVTDALCYDKTAITAPDPKPLPHRTPHPARKIDFFITSHDQGWASGQAAADSEGGSRYQYSWTWFDARTIADGLGRMRAHAADREACRQRGEPVELHPPGVNVLPIPPPRPDPDDWPRDRMLQMNPVADRQPRDYFFSWRYDDALAPDTEGAEQVERHEGRGRCTLDGQTVRELRVGDSLGIWAKARYPGWVNHVDYLAVRVYWAV